MDGAEIIIGWRSALIFAVCLPIVIIAFILLFRKTERRANLFLAGALLAIVWSMGPQIIGFANGYSVWPGLTFFPFNSELLIAPLIYAHANALMVGKDAEGNGLWNGRTILLLPGFAALIYYIWAFLSLGDYKAKWAFSKAVHTPYIYPVILIVTLLMAALCAVLIMRLIKRYRFYLAQTHSAAKDFDPVWLIWMFGIGGLAGVVWMSLGLISLFKKDITYIQAYPFQLTVMIIFSALGFLALLRINETFPKMSGSASLSLTEPAQNEPAQQSPDERNWAKEGDILKQTVLDKKWHLEPRLSIRDVATRMGTNETYLSRALNKGLGQSFNRFINSLRVEQAKTDIAANQTTLLNIGMDAGFNSKATFNRVFRDIAGETPSAYKKRVLKNTL